MAVYAFGKLGHKLHFGADGKAVGAKWEPERQLDLFLDEVRPEKVVVVSAHNEIPAYLRDRGVVSYLDYGVMDNQDVEELLFLESFSGMIFWVGDNAVSLPIPCIAGKNKGKPVGGLQSDIANTGPIVRLVNAWMDADPVRNQPHFLHPDMRYPVKTRDFKWPFTNTIHSQLDFEYNRKIYDFGDDRVGVRARTDGTAQWTDDDGVWQCRDTYQYDGVETLAMARQPVYYADEGARQGVLLIANHIKRAPLRDKLVASLKATRVQHFGADWPSPSITPLVASELYPTMARYKAGVIPTASAYNAKMSGAATLKFWEHVVCGVIPIAPPGYDAQHHLPFPPNCRARDYQHLHELVMTIPQTPDDIVREWQDEALIEMQTRARALSWALTH